MDHASQSPMFGVSLLVENGTPLPYYQPLMIEPISAVGVWHEFAFGERGVQPLLWLVNGPALIDLRDLYCPGDRFALLFEGPWLSEPTSWVEIRDQCNLQHGHSKRSYRVGAGLHRIQLVVHDSPFGGGRGALRLRPE